MKKKISIVLILCMLAMCVQTAVLADGDLGLSNLIIRQGADASFLCWVNDTGLSDLSITDCKSGEEVDVSQVDFTKGAINQIPAPLIEGGLSEYEITCNHRTVIVQSVPMQESTTAYTPLNSDGWMLTGRTKLCAAEFVELSGNKALHLTRYNNAIALFSGTATEGYETGKTYQLSFDYRSKNTGSLVIRFGGVNKTVELPDSEEWATITEEFGITSTPSALNAQISGADADLWLDNVSVRLLADGVPTGGNLIENGDFESSEVPEAISELAGEGTEDGVRFSWEEADCNGYQLWINDECVAYLDASVTEYEITGLEEDTPVTAAIAVKGKNGLFSELTEASANSGLVNLPIPDQSPYQPKYVIVRKSGDADIIVWKNPKTAPKEIAVYKLSADGAVFIEGEYIKTANAINEINLGASGADYYKLKLEFADGTVSEQFATARNVSYGAYHNWNGANADVRIGFNLTDENPHGGAYAYHLFRTVDKNAHLNYTGDTSMITAGTYQLGFWYRGSDYNSIAIQLEENKNVSVPTATEDWQYAETTFTVKNHAPTLIFKLNSIPDVYLDDITLFRVENGETVGENLLENGDFETVTPMEGVKSYTHETGDGEAMLSWELPSDTNCAGVNVYANGQLKGSFFAGMNQATIGGLVNGRKNRIKLVTITNGGAPVGKAVEFSVLPKAADYKVHEIVLKKGEARAAKLSEGSFTVSVEVANAQTDSMDATLAVAIYADGEMLPLLTDVQKIADKKTLSQSFTITQEMLAQEIFVKCFVLDGLNTKKALSGMTVFSEAGV